MRQFVGQLRDDSTVRDLLLTVAPAKVRKAAAEVDGTELLMMEHDTEAVQLAYAQALVDWGDAGGYEYETLWDTCTVAAIGHPLREGAVAAGHDPVRRRAEAARPRGAAPRARGRAAARRAGQLPRRPGQALARGPARGLAEDGAVRLARPRAAEPRRHPDRHARAGCRGRHVWVHPGRFATYARGPPATGTTASRSCAGAGTRNTPSSRRWS